MQDAWLYYEQQQAGLGERFLLELEQKLTVLSEHPEYYSYIDSRKILRDVTVNNFPYVIVFAIIDNEVRVYAVLLTHRRPLSNYGQ